MRAVPVLVLAGLCGALSAAGFVGHLWSLDAGEAVEALRSAQPVAQGRLADAVRTSRAASHLSDGSTQLTRAAAAFAALSPDRQRALRAEGYSQETLVVAALRQAPVNPYNWARLAAIRFGRSDLRGAGDALMQSIALGAHTPNVAAWRAHMALDLASRGETALADVARQQVLTAAASQPALLAQYHRDARFVNFCHSVLAGHEADHRAFIAALRTARQART